MFFLSICPGFRHKILFIFLDCIIICHSGNVITHNLLLTVSRQLYGTQELFRQQFQMPDIIFIELMYQLDCFILLPFALGFIYTCENIKLRRSDIAPLTSADIIISGLSMLWTITSCTIVSSLRFPEFPNVFRISFGISSSVRIPP